MQVWAPEGFVGADLARRKLTLTQPAVHLRQGRLDSRRLDAGATASLKAELFGRHLQVRELECEARRRPADAGIAGLRSLRAHRRAGRAWTAGRAATRWRWPVRVLEAMTAHRWDGAADGPTGSLATADAARPAVHFRGPRGCLARPIFGSPAHWMPGCSVCCRAFDHAPERPPTGEILTKHEPFTAEATTCPGNCRNPRRRWRPPTQPARARPGRGWFGSSPSIREGPGPRASRRS